LRRFKIASPFKVRFIIIVMKKKVMVEEQLQEDPAVLLERIMKADVTSANRIAVARKEADRRIATVQEEAVNSKKEAYVSGRRTRARLVENGLIKAKAVAEEKLQQSEYETSKIIENGKQYIPDAVSISLEFILGSKSKENSYDS
jgi:vacuolar-type H+-ATPase subunit H